MIVTAIGPTSTRDNNGNWITAAPVEDDDNPIRCRYETSDGNGYVTSEGGTQEYYDAIIYAPLPIDQLPLGTSVVVYDEKNRKRAKGTVKHFQKGQLNARIWI